MNSKERVVTALTRKGLPDRVPLQFDLSRSLADRFGEEYGVPTHYTTAYYEGWRWVATAWWEEPACPAAINTR